MGLSLPHLLLAAVVVLILFGGKGKISDIMGDVARGIKSFKKGLADDEAPAKPAEMAGVIEHQPQVGLEKASEPRKAG